jgi:hypothetical protein
VRVQRGQRGRSSGVPRRAAAVPRVEETLAEVDGAAANDLDDLVEADREARRLAERAAVA